MSSDSESDAPEAVTLAHSATTARGHERAIQTFRESEKQKAKDRNRNRDRRLKEQSKGKKDAVGGKSKEKGKNVVRDVGDDDEDEEMDEESKRLLARMARAMDEAEGESDGEGEREDGDEFEGLGAIGGDNDDEGSEDEDEGDESEEDEEDTSMDEDEDEDAAPPNPNNKYLPDHLFTVALSKSRPPKAQSSQPSSSSQKPSKKRKRAHNRPKDIVLGSRVIRTLPPANSARTPAPTVGTTTPPARVHRFLSRALALKGKKKGQGWERKAVNIGLSKRSGGPPVTGFVRAQ